MTPEQFMIAARAEPFAWETHSCAHLVDRWFQLRTGRSFLAAYGADCSTEVKAEALMARTPLPIMLGRAMRKLGIARVAEPGRGDVGVIAVGPWVICAVKGSSMWLFRGDTGFGAIRDPRVIAIWSVG